MFNCSIPNWSESIKEEQWDFLQSQWSNQKRWEVRRVVKRTGFEKTSSVYSIYWQCPWMHKAGFALDFNSECLTLRLRDWVLPIWGRGRGSHLGKHLSDLSCLPLPLHLHLYLYLTPDMCICLSRNILTSSCKRIGRVHCNYIAASIEEKHVDALATS